MCALWDEYERLTKKTLKIAPIKIGFPAMAKSARPLRSAVVSSVDMGCGEQSDQEKRRRRGEEDRLKTRASNIRSALLLSSNYRRLVPCYVRQGKLNYMCHCCWQHGAGHASLRNRIFLKGCLKGYSNRSLGDRMFRNDARLALFHRYHAISLMCIDVVQYVFPLSYQLPIKRNWKMG